MHIRCTKRLSVFHGVLLSLLASYPVAAQIKPDTTLPHNSLSTQLGNVIKIDGGTRAGSNLFHSFTKFNVPTGGTAFFNNSLDVSNIFSRVTGGTASVIDGILKANGTASLFLLNPNGIIFGKNAQLNIGGSFLGTTATNIKFADGTLFSVTQPTQAPLLTVSVPIGLGFGTRQPGALVNNGQLGVNQQQNLSLIGGTVVSTGHLIAPGGNVLIRTMPGENGTSEVQPLSLSELLAIGGNNPGLSVTSSGVNLTGSGIPVATGDVVAKQVSALSATLDATHNLTLVESNLQTTGDLHLKAGNTVLVRDSLATPFLTKAGGNLNIRGDSSIDILTLNRSAVPFQSGGNTTLMSNGLISTDAHFTSGGNFTISNLAGKPANFISKYDPIFNVGGDYSVGDYTGVSLQVKAGGNISYGTVAINGIDSAVNPTNPVLALNAGGTITGTGNISTTMPGLLVQLLAKGNISTQDISTQGGNINIESTNGDISTGVLDTTYSNSGTAGNGGAINLNSKGALTTGFINSYSLSYSGTGGNGGAITLNSQGALTTGGIDSYSLSYSGTGGNGGAINLNSQGALTTGYIDSYSSSTYGTAGNGGAINLNSQGALTTGYIDSHSSSTYGTAGNGGAITLNSQGALTTGVIDSDSISQFYGTAGNGGAINLNSQGALTTGDIHSYSRYGTAGNGGAINLNSQGALKTGDIESYSSSRYGTGGNGGAINLNSQGALTTGYIASSSYSISGTAGNGGAINLNSQAALTTGYINSSSSSRSGTGGNGGAINLNSQGALTTTGYIYSSSYSNSGTGGNGGAINLNSQGALTTGYIESYSYSNSGNSGNGGAINLNSQGALTTGYIDSYSITPSGNSGNGGAINLNSQGALTTGVIESYSYSNSGTGGNGGAINLNSQGALTPGVIESYSYSNSGTGGNGGEIMLTSKNGDIGTNSLSSTIYSFSVSQAANSGNGGNVTLSAKNNINNIEILTLSSGAKAGAVQFTGSGDLSITNTSIITSKQLVIKIPFYPYEIAVNVGGIGQSGDVNITSNGNLTINSSNIQSDAKGSSPAGNIFITSPGLITFNNSYINSNTSSTGIAGNILINAGKGINLTDAQSYLSAQTSNIGKAGDITLNTPTLTLANGAKIFANTSGSGNGGTITVNAPNSVDIGKGVENSATILSVETSGAGKAGDIIINTPSLTVSDTAQLTATATSTATNPFGGGNITLNASKMDLAGLVGIFAETQGQSPAGKLTLNPYNNQPNLDITLAPGSKISASTTASGRGGDLLLTAPQAISIAGQGTLAVETSGSGNAGNIQITAPQLTLTNGVNISAFSTGSGQGGNIFVNTNDFSITEGAKLSATTASGNGGNINIQTGTLMMRHNSPITADARTGSGNSTGNGGNININANTITALENSPITANADQGKGGNIQITTQGLFNSPNSPITASLGNPQLNDVVQVTTFGFSATNSLTQFKGNAIATQQTIANSCLTRRNQQRGKFTVTGLDTLPITPFTDYDAWYALPPQPTNTTSQQKPSTLPPVATTQSKPWKIGDPIIEAQGIVHTKDGRIILTSTPQNTTPELANLLVCHTDNDTHKS